MRVTWTLSADDATGISLYRDGELATEATSDTSSYVDSDLDPNTRYEYRIEVGRRDSPNAVDSSKTATLAYPPRISSATNSHFTGFDIPIVDELNPENTEYRVTVHRGGHSTTTDDWSETKCRTFAGLEPDTAYHITVVARNLDGIEARANKLASGYDISPSFFHTTSLPASDDPWVKARVSELGQIFGLTEAAVEWMNSDIHIEWKRAEPGWFGAYVGARIGVGFTGIYGLMHEVMHAFWGHWDGFQEPCDQMNIYTFRRDSAQFVLDFREHDRSGKPNPWEPWRPYFDWMVQLLEINKRDDENYWDILEEQDFHRLGGFYHLMETTLPVHAAGKMNLIPPPLQKYMQGFLKEGRSTTWAEETDWYSRLGEEDRRLWQQLSGEGNTRTPLDLRVHAQVQDAAIDESLRETLRLVERQRLIDFINSLDEVARFEHWRKDPRFWRSYVEDRISLVALYLDELDSSVGIELDDSTFDAVVESLWAVWRIHVGKEDWPHGHESISSIEGLSELQRAAFLRMIGGPTITGSSPTFGSLLDSNRWLLYGSAKHVPSAEIIQLTPARNDQLGMLVHRELTNTESLHVEFSFEIGGGSGADGLAFLLLRAMPDFSLYDPRYHYGGGWGSRYLEGYAVVFDTFMNEIGSYSVGGRTLFFPITDPSHNFVALAELGAGSYGFDIAYLDSKNLDQQLSNSGVFDAEVELNDDGRLKVYLSNAQIGMERTLVIDHTIENYAPFEGYIGFMAATGGLTDQHFIHSVRFEGE